MRDDDLAAVAALLRAQRWAGLATVEPDGQPYGSAVAYVAEADFSGFLLHLSRLAPHTRNLLADPRASLVVSETDGGAGDPQTLARVSLLGRVELIARETPAYEEAKARYLARLSSAAHLFEFPDFHLFRLVPTEARFVGGFARARTLGAEALRRAALV